MRLCEYCRRSGGNDGREDVCETKARPGPGQGVVAFARMSCSELGSSQHLCQLTEHSRNSSNPLRNVLTFPFFRNQNHCTMAMICLGSLCIPSKRKSRFSFCHLDIFL